MTPNHAHCWLWDEPSTSTVAFLKRVPRDREVHAAEKGLEPWHRPPPPPLPGPPAAELWMGTALQDGRDGVLSSPAGAGMHRNTLWLQQERC